MDSTQTFSPRFMLPSPPPSPPWSCAPPPSSVHIMPHNAVPSDPDTVYLHPILESALLVPPCMMNEPRKPLPADINNRLSELATTPGLGFLTLILLPGGRHIPVQPSAVGRGTVTLGDVLHVLKELCTALQKDQSIVRAQRDATYRAHIVDQETQKNPRQGPVRKGLWTWVVDGKPVVGYLTIGVEDVVWPRH